MAQLPLRWLCYLIPKDSRLCVFGSALGYQFADNSKYLFLYVNRHRSDLRPVWITRSEAVENALKKAGLECLRLPSPRAVWTILRARNAFLSHSTQDVHPVLLGGTKAIQLWHGTPLKKIAYDADWSGLDKSNPLKNAVRRALYTVFPYLYDSAVFDSICIASENIVPSYCSAFHISDEKTAIVGQPRNDALSDGYEFDATLFPEMDELRGLRDRYRTLMAWLPTHRRPAPTTIVDLLFDYGFDPPAWDNWLAEKNACLIVKAHFLEFDALREQLAKCQHVLVYPHSDPYPLLRFTDLLLTDYSSVYFDFLLMDRAVIFTPFDYDVYVREIAQLYYPYDEVTPGPHCRNWSEVRSAVEAMLQGENSFAAERLITRDRFNAQIDGFSSRVCERFLS